MTEPELSVLPDFLGQHPKFRLLAAVAASLALHGLLIYGIRVDRGGAGSAAPLLIEARLVPSMPAGKGNATPPPAAEAPAPPEPAPAPEPLPLRAVSETAPDERARKPTPAARINPLPPDDAPRPSPPLENPPAAEPAPPGPEIPLISDPTWYSAKDLDELPRPLSKVMPAYPLDANMARVQGKVVMEVLIDEQGFVTEISVLEAEPKDWFEEAALAAVKGTRFAPGEKNGRPVKSRVRVPVFFELN